MKKNSDRYMNKHTYTKYPKNMYIDCAKKIVKEIHFPLFPLVGSNLLGRRHMTELEKGYIHIT